MGADNSNMTTTLEHFTTDWARLESEGWRIFGGPGLWWARCPSCIETIDATNFVALVAVADAHASVRCTNEA